MAIGAATALAAISAVDDIAHCAIAAEAEFFHWVVPPSDEASKEAEFGAYRVEHLLIPVVPILR